MTENEFYDLRPGDIIQNEGSGNTYQVLYVLDNQLVVARTLIASNPNEWILIGKVQKWLRSRSSTSSKRDNQNDQKRNP